MFDCESNENTNCTREMLGRIIGADIRIIHGLLDLPTDHGGNLSREHILVGEMIVEAAFRNLRGSDDFIDAHAINMARSKQSPASVHQCLSGTSTPTIDLRQHERLGGHAFKGSAQVDCIVHY
jgi:hypothetical protein